MSDQLPPPGWYPDPERPGQQRWWDGQQWAASVEQPPAAPTPPQDDWTSPGTQPGQGWPQAPSDPAQSWPSSQPAKPPTNGMAIAALVLSLLWVCGLGSVAAIVLGIVALRQIARSHEQLAGRGLAIAGIVVGAVGVLGAIVGVVILVAAGDTITDVIECSTDPNLTEAEVEQCVEDVLDRIGE